MRKTEIDSILLVNWYFTTCKLTKPSCPRTEMVRKYLLQKVNKALDSNDKPTGNRLLSKAFIFLILLVVSNF
jgi:hypothetical protein